jgi:hypothetical protein
MENNFISCQRPFLIICVTPGVGLVVVFVSRDCDFKEYIAELLVLLMI